MPEEVIVKRARATAETDETRVEQIFAVDLGRRRLEVAFVSSDVRSPAVRLTAFAPPPSAGGYRRREELHMPRLAELDALMSALADARARLVDAHKKP
jgi:hypothetical protein